MRKERITYRKKTNESISFVIEKDYTQVYDCFSKMSIKIHSGTSYKLLFWLLANKTSDGGGIQVDAIVFREFNEFLSEECGPDCTVVRSTFDKCVAELREAGALTMLTRGHYQANAYGFWREGVKDRKDFLLKEYKNGKHSFFNPDHNTKLIDDKGSARG